MVTYGFRGNEPQINADERRYKPVMEFDKTIHRKGRKERKVKRQESSRQKYQPAPRLSAIMRGG